MLTGSRWSETVFRLFVFEEGHTDWTSVARLELMRTLFFTFYIFVFSSPLYLPV